METGAERNSSEIESVSGRLEIAVNKLVVDVAEMRGRLAQTPTTIQLISLVLGIFGLAFALLELFL